MWIIIKSWMAANWEWFKGFFSEESGPSTTRALNWIWMLFLCGNLTFITIYTAHKTHEAKLPPLEATSGYVAITSLLLAAKVGQRIWGENPVTGQSDVSGSMISGSATTPSSYVPPVVSVVNPPTPNTGSVASIP